MEWAKDKLGDFLSFGGGEGGGKAKYTPTAGVEQWRSLAMRALQIEGVYSHDNLNRMLMQMKTESSGNPNI